MAHKILFITGVNDYAQIVFQSLKYNITRATGNTEPTAAETETSVTKALRIGS